MAPGSVKTTHPARERFTRREVLTAATAFALGPALAAAGDPPAVAHAAGGPEGDGSKTPPAASQPAQPADRPRLPTPWWLKASAARSRVVEINSRLVMRSSVVDVITLGDMVEQGLMALTGAKDVEQAWRAVLNRPKNIAIKFNSVGAELIATNAAMARVLIDHLLRAGFDPATVRLIEAPAHLADELGTATPVDGWADEIRVGANREALARYLLEAEAVINVPVLKSHQIAGMSGCLKNLSHAVIRHPGRYHAGGCAPFVGEVVGAQKVSQRLKLNILSALRIVADRGPDAREEDLATMGAILLGFDPVAVDSVGLGLLSVERRRRSLEVMPTPHVTAAGADGVGRWHPADIEHIALGAEP